MPVEYNIEKTYFFISSGFLQACAKEKPNTSLKATTFRVLNISVVFSATLYHGGRGWD